MYNTTDSFLYEKLKEKFQEYLEAIKDVGFAKLEYQKLNHTPESPEELFEAICSIIDTSKELNQVIEQSPSSIYIADRELNTMRINKSFEVLTGIKRETLLEKNTVNLEEENVFSPSVCTLALKEKRRVVVQQLINDEKSFITAGVPILDEKGEVFRVITNALLDESTSNMSAYLQNQKGRKVEPPQKMIAESSEMKDILHLADLIKDTKTTILIEGETGVGKSMLARYIHETSNRGGEKMMEINCGAIPAALLESELFGYEGGAFTGADRRGKAGLIEISEGGTILLDEISELPLLLQVKLLHFLQNKRIKRVGGTEEIEVDVRVIAATNKKLELLVEKGDFRQDLYYRLNVVPIVIPPLRMRKEDIMPAAYYFINKYTKLYNKNLPVNQSCIDYFQNNAWKGNLRELENCIERLVVTEGTIKFGNSPEEHIKGSDDGVYKENAVTADKKINEVEREMIIDAYKKYGSSYKVAEALGISQSTAYRKIRKYLGK